MRLPLWMLYDDLNRQFFDGRLPRTIRPGWFGKNITEIEVVRIGVDFFSRGLRSRNRGNGYSVGRFRPVGGLSPARIDVISEPAEFERRVLLPEMIQADLYLRGDRDVGHGPDSRPSSRAWRSEKPGRSCLRDRSLISRAAIRTTTLRRRARSAC